MRRVLRVSLLPALALVAVLAWMLASPVGAGPDDDFHLTSTWCLAANDGGLCEPAADAGERVVADDLTDAPCFAPDPTRSAACQESLWASDAAEATRRGNWIGAYPPVYYAVMSVFASPDVPASALAMRLVTVLLAAGLTAALLLLLPAARRGVLLWTWVVTTVPLGLFLFGTNNPSAWAVVGVGSAWLALLGYYESSGRRRVGLAIVAAVAVLMAAGSRGDAALYVGLGIAVAMVLAFARTRAYLLASILPVVLGLVALAFFLTSRQVDSGVSGFSGGGSALPGPGGASDRVTGGALLAYNLLNVPFLWSGVFGTWGLGWLDTSLPWIVPLASMAAFVAVAAAGLARKSGRQLAVAIAAALVLVALPVYVLQAGGDMVGEQVQPRYLYPLIVLVAGLLVLAPRGRELRLGRVPAYTVAVALAVANFVALHMNIRRYVTGIDGAGFDLDAGAEWWWALPIGPNVVWIVGSLAYAALVLLLVPRLAAGRPLVVGAATRA